MEKRGAGPFLFASFAAAMVGVAAAPLIVEATAATPVAQLAERAGILLARLLPPGPIVESASQPPTAREFFFVPLMGHFVNDDVLRWMGQWSVHMALCAGMLWAWGRWGYPARNTRSVGWPGFARALFRTVWRSALWAIALAVAQAQLRIVLVSWHNVTLGRTWQAYDGFVYTEAAVWTASDWAAAAAYVLGIAAISRREAEKPLRQLQTPAPSANCPACGYATVDLKVCPECGAATDAAAASRLYFTAAHARISKSALGWAIWLIVGGAIFAGLIAPLTKGLTWALRHRLGI